MYMKKKVLIISIFLLLIIIIFSIILFQYIDKKDNKVSFEKKYISDLNNINSNISEEYINEVLEENINTTNIVEETQVISEIDKNKEQSVTESNNTKIQNNTIFNNTKNVETKTEKTENNIADNDVLKENEKKTEVTESDEINKNQDIVEKNNENEQKIERCTNNLNHGISIGNSNKWFETKEEAITYYNQLRKDYGYKFENEQMSQEEYNKKCPYGYEVWSCMFCNKWTINFYYRDE